MTTYTAIPTTDIDSESPVDEAVLTLLRDNPIAMIEGDPSAPGLGADMVDTAQIVAAAIGRSEIANSTTTSAGTITANNEIDISLNNWALFPMIHVFQATDVHLNGHSVDGSGAGSPRFAFNNRGGSNRLFDVDHRWIIAA